MGNLNRNPGSGVLGAVILLLLFAAASAVLAAAAEEDGTPDSRERVVIVFRDSITNEMRDSVFSASDVEFVGECKQLRAVIVLVDDAEQFISEVQENDFVEYAEADVPVQAFGASPYEPDDPAYPEQWYLQQIRADTAWDVEKGNRDIVLAVVDSGIDYTHEDLGNYVQGGYDWVNDDPDPLDDFGHGTHCAGIAAASLDNGVGIAGLANVSILAEKVLDSSGSGYASDVARGICAAADQGADVISLSLGSSSPTKLEEEACSYAWEKGCVLVAASGNSYGGPVAYPAAYASVIAVGSTGPSDLLSSFSSMGQGQELVAPGETIYSTVPDSAYGYLNGTSMAAPQAAALAALVLSGNPGLSNAQVRSVLALTADDLGAAGPDPEYGFGRINAERAISLDTAALDTDGRDVLFDLGHGNFFDPSIDWNLLLFILIDEGYTVDLLFSEVTPEILADYDLFISSLPEGGFTAEEIAAIQGFIAGGEGALFVGERNGDWIGNLNEVTGSYGIQLNPDSVFDPTDNDGQDFWPVIYQFADHPVTDGVEGYVMYAGCSLNVGGEAEAIASGDEDTFTFAPLSVEGLSLASISSVPPDGAAPSAVIPGAPVTLAVWNGTGRVAVSGDANMFSGVDLDADGIITLDEYDNLRLSLQLVDWLAGEEDEEDGDFVNVLSVNSALFPKIYTFVNVDTDAGNAGELTAEDFSIYEDGVEQTIESFNFTTSGSLTEADILFVFDDTGSMGDEIGAMKANVKDLTDQVNASGIDARYALVSFKDDVEVDQAWTSDPEVLKTAVDGLVASGGGDGPEADLDAIEAGLALGFRPTAQRVIIDITDAPTHYRGDGSGFSNYTMPEVEADLIAAGVTYIAVSPQAGFTALGNAGEEYEAFTEPTDTDKRVLAEAVGGLWINIHGDEFAEILDYIGAVLTTTYVIDYTTGNPARDGSDRTVEVEVEDPVEGKDSDEGKYVAPTESFVNVLSVNSALFPKIYTFVSVNTTAGNAGELGPEAFTVYENGVEQTIESFNFTTNESASAADILFVFDDTGSMGDEIGAMKTNVKNLTDQVEASGIDARYALVTFKDDVEVDLGWTSDPEVLKTAVDALVASGGGDGREDDLDAIEAGLELGFRPTAQRVVIDITDAPTHYRGDGSGFSEYTMPEVEADLLAAGVTYIAVSPQAGFTALDNAGQEYEAFTEPEDQDKRLLAEAVGGLWINIHGEDDFSGILEYIGTVLTSTYVIDYTTTDPVPDGTNRTVTVAVDDPVEGAASDTGRYVAPTKLDFVDVLGVNPALFPKIFVFVNVNTTAGLAGELGPGAFTVYEDGEVQVIESFNFTKNDTVSAADILFVFDDTGSMGDEIGDMKASVKDLTDQVNASGIDARYALVTFKDDVEVDLNWTSDPEALKTAVDAMIASGGGDGPEDDLDAIEAGLALGFRPAAQRVVIDITDAPTHYRGDGTGFSNYTMPEVEADLIANGVTYIAVSPDSGFTALGNAGEEYEAFTEPEDTDKRVLAEAVGGLWIDIHGEDGFSEILDRIGAVLTATYIIDYTTGNPAKDGTNRTVTVAVSDPEGTASDTGRYVAPAGDWNPWNDPDSEGGEAITLTELQEAVNAWLTDTPAPGTGETVTLERLQELINAWLGGE